MFHNSTKRRMKAVCSLIAVLGSLTIRTSGPVFLLWFVTVIPAVAESMTVPGTANVWLSGMPNGARPGNVGEFVPDIAPAQSPVLVPRVLSNGERLRFRASGIVDTTAAGGPPGFGPDGFFGAFVPAGNGISAVSNVLGSLTGVFLGPEQPDLSAAPGGLVFIPNPALLDYQSLAPELKQVFFIGDGLTSGGVQQEIIVPAGASRLFLGVFDVDGNYDNVGSFDVTVVPEPSFAGLSGLIAALTFIALAKRKTAGKVGQYREQRR
jgi:hypothetical protein